MLCLLRCRCHGRIRLQQRLKDKAWQSESRDWKAIKAKQLLMTGLGTPSPWMLADKLHKTNRMLGQ